MNNYSNLPSSQSNQSSDQTVEIFSNYYKEPISLNYSELTAMTGFFQKRGFEPVAAESAATIILVQAAQDGYNAMQVMDTLGGLTSVEISGLVAEILNFNRVKTSLLGTVQDIQPIVDITRNVVA
jgi:hypothetical protein